MNDYREVTTYSPDSSNPTEMILTAQDWDPAASGGQGAWVNRDREVQTRTNATEVVQTEQDWDPAANGGQGDWVNREQQVVTLTTDGDFVEFLDRTWDPAANGGQGDWTNESRGTFVYNDQGLIVENTTQIWDGGQWVNESRLLQRYGDFTGTTVEDDNPEVSFRLQANYPNPFTSETTIRFALPAAQHVTLEVFDLPGRRIPTWSMVIRHPEATRSFWRPKAWQGDCTSTVSWGTTFRFRAPCFTSGRRVQVAPVQARCWVCTGRGQRIRQRYDGAIWQFAGGQIRYPGRFQSDFGVASVLAMHVGVVSFRESPMSRRIGDIF